MSFTLYAQYAAYAALLILAIVLVSLAFWSWLVEVRFRVNYIWIKATNPKLHDLMDEFEDFDKHVDSTIGMRYSPDYR